MNLNARNDPAPLRALDTCTQVANVIGSLLIVGLVLLIGADVLGRNLFAAPISGVPEMVKLSIVAIVFLQAPQALKAGRMTRSDALIDRINARFPALGGAMETLFDVLAMIVVGAIFYATWPIFTKSWTRGDFVGAAGDFTAPTWPVKLMILIGAALLLLQFLARIARRYMRRAHDPL
ncbi:TRAP transporter small permease subunit [Marimonas sp. MJW-29]|uniref:TRAP transporter small permease protein n=1 Tax=Sulfitobacter sediminis TaxID=3234186 RepID=A0ABV3RRK6_9RHOB